LPNLIRQWADGSIYVAELFAFQVSKVNPGEDWAAIGQDSTIATWNNSLHRGLLTSLQHVGEGREDGDLPGHQLVPSLGQREPLGAVDLREAPHDQREQGSAGSSRHIPTKHLKAPMRTPNRPAGRRP
jgi:hypothetical protein